MMWHKCSEYTERVGVAVTLSFNNEIYLINLRLCAPICRSI